MKSFIKKTSFIPKKRTPKSIKNKKEMLCLQTISGRLLLVGKNNTFIGKFKFEPIIIYYLWFCFENIVYVILLKTKYLIYMSWVQVTLDVIINNVIPSNNLLLNLYFENLTVRLQFYIFLTCMPIFISIRCYLLFDP